MRLLLFYILFVASLSGAAVPPDVKTALLDFHTEGPQGWSFTQTTTAEGRRLVERYDAGQPEFRRWTLLEQDGRAPDPAEQQNYREKFSRRSRGGTAPRLSQQLDLATLVEISDTVERTTFAARFKPGEEGDGTAAFLRAVFIWHKPSATIESFTIESTGPFSPTFGVKIAEMHTSMTYSLPGPDRPSLLQRVTTRLRGRAFWFKSLDADMVVTCTDFKPVKAYPHP